MTKKIFCLLLCAFLGVSLIALFAACHNAGQTPDEPETSTDLSLSSTDANAALTEKSNSSDAPTAAATEEDTAAQEAATTDVFSLELPSAETED